MYTKWAKHIDLVPNPLIGLYKPFQLTGFFSKEIKSGLNFFNAASNS